MTDSEESIDCIDKPGSRTLCLKHQPIKADWTSFSFWKRPRFYIIGFTTVSHSLAHFLPALYLPSYATDLGVSQTNASLLLTYYNLVCMVSQPIYGALA